MERPVKSAWYFRAFLAENTKLDKRSLASKYLHFHYAHLRYESARRAAPTVSRPLGKRQAPGAADLTYRKFCLKVLALRDQIEKTYGPRLHPRELDNLLLEVARIGATQKKGNVRNRQIESVPHSARRPALSRGALITSVRLARCFTWSL
jgi:hypothetical protein